MTKAVGTAGGTATGYVFFAARRTALATLLRVRLFMCVVTVIWSYFMNTWKKSGGFLKGRLQ